MGQTVEMRGFRALHKCPKGTQDIQCGLTLADIGHQDDDRTTTEDLFRFGYGQKTGR